MSESKDKKTIRLLVKANIALLTSEEKTQESSEVCQKLMQRLNQIDFETLITYEAFLDELDVSILHHWCRDKWKNIVIIPQSLDDFECPRDSFIIVPWRAFTIEGKRIGRWGGFYDELLSKYPTLHSIGVCYNCQIFENIAQDSWDRPVVEVVFAQNTLE